MCVMQSCGGLNVVTCAFNITCKPSMRIFYASRSFHQSDLIRIDIHSSMSVPYYTSSFYLPPQYQECFGLINTITLTMHH